MTPEQARQIKQLHRQNLRSRELPYVATVYTDASFRHDDGYVNDYARAAWGCLAWGPERHVVRSGLGPNWTETALEAELYGVYEGVRTATRELNLRNAHSLIVICDNWGVCRRLGQGNSICTNHRKKAASRLVIQMLEMAEEANVRLVASWANDRLEDGNYTNANLIRQADKLAKDARRHGKKEYKVR